MTKVLIITNDIVSNMMAGPGIRALEMARVLSSENEVILAIPNDTDLNVSNIRIIKYNYKIINRLSKISDVIIIQGYILLRFPFLRKTKACLIVDMYDPFIFEIAEQFNEGGDINKLLWIHAEARNALNDQNKSGDCFLCASDKQKDFWIGMLTANNRINPVILKNDKNLEKFIRIVPFGLPVEEPVHTRNVLKGVYPGINKNDKVIMWGGGIWDWFDPITLIKAVNEISKKRDDVKLFFMGVKHPNSDVSKMSIISKVIELSKHFGINNKYVFFNQWVSYEDRQNYLLESDIGVSLHLESIEALYSFRTRILDYIWARLPILATKGDYMSNIIREKGLGIVVGYGNVKEVENAILKLLDDNSERNKIKRNCEYLRSEFTWHKVMLPVLEICRNPQKSADKKYKYTFYVIEIVKYLKRKLGLNTYHKIKRFVSFLFFKIK